LCCLAVRHILTPRLFLHRARPPPALHSFPTRRSSDLVTVSVARHDLQRQLRIPHSALRINNHSAFRIGTHELTAGKKSLTRPRPDRKSTRLNSSHQIISYAVFCLKKKNKNNTNTNKNQ